ncbi:MAG: flagellar basal body L-ring protein FlgH [Verrucomicrobia bacterium]|nr:flagellar basal body L-ring protein FlgH [Verrucomicrobiota bacterium]
MRIPLKFRSNVWLALGALLGSMSVAQADSLWTKEASQSLVGDKKARAVGDIITVIVEESNQTKKDSSTKTDKSSELDASIESFLFSPGASKFMTHNGKLPAMGMTSKNGFEGKGAINNSETITHRFGVRVVDVLPNGNLIVEGLRQTSFSGESQTVILRGTVRGYDVSSSNTVMSFNLADVSIRFDSSGSLSNAQKKGWFSRAWDVLTPF